MANADTIYCHPLPVQQKHEEKFKVKASGNGLVVMISSFFFFF